MAAPEIGHLFAALPRLRAWGQREMDVPAQHGHPKRSASLALHAGPLTLLPPRQPKGQAPLSVWVVWVHELSDPPADAERLDWVLLTSLPTADAAAAWDRVAWYRCRWLVEEYHSCLKSGCQLERCQLRHEARLGRLLGLLAPMAVYLLQLRDLARANPQRLAAEALPATLVQVVAALAQVPAARFTLAQFWTAASSRSRPLAQFPR